MENGGADQRVKKCKKIMLSKNKNEVKEKEKDRKRILRF